MRAHVDEVHAIAPIGGFLRGLVSTVTRLGANPTIFHGDVDGLVQALQRKHRINPAELRDCIARV